MIQSDVKAIVVGAGPAGIAVVAKLLGRGESNIVWIDTDWKGGYLGTVPEVPSNTNVSLFIKYAEFVGLTPQDSPALHLLMQQPQDKGCKLKYAHAMLLDCLSLLKPQVACITGKVVSVVKENRWIVTLNNGINLSAQSVFLCQGARHKRLPGMDSSHPLELILNGQIPKGPTKAAVIGSSHSGMLAAMNLVESGRVKECHIYYRSAPELTYAQVLNGDVIINDNIGLKGVVADWCQEHFGPSLKSCQIRDVRIYCYPYPGQLEAFDLVVSAIGFERNPISLNNNVCLQSGKELWGELDANGLYGFGIAFPECMDGTTAVGLWKFVKTVNKVLQ